MKNEKYRHDTTLSLHIWELKDTNEDFEIDWKIIGRAQPFSPISVICNLCTLEKIPYTFFNQIMSNPSQKQPNTNFFIPNKQL